MNAQSQLILHEAFQAFQAGDLINAEKILRDFLETSAQNFDALHLLAIICANQSKHHEAIDLYKAAALNTNDPSVLSNLGSSLSVIGQHQEALFQYQKALEINSNAPEFWYNAGNTLCDLMRHEEALFYYEQSIRLDPKYFESHNNYGKALFDLGRFSESLTHYDDCLSINHFFLDCLINKGEVLRALKRYREALECIEKIIYLKPDYAEAWSNKGIILNELKRYDEAIAHYDKALSLKPDYAEAWSNKGVTLHELKRYDEAIAHYDKALSLKPDYAEGLHNKGASLNELGCYDEAIAHYDRALSLKPEIDWAFGYLLHTKMKICDWSVLTDSLSDISKKLQANKKISKPFPLLALIDDAELHKKSSEIYIQSNHQSNAVLGPALKSSENQKIRVGYFSADFHNHATGYLMAELFELHDKGQFELFGFSFGPIANDEMRKRLKTSFDQFIEVGNKSDIEIAQLSRGLNIDIAIDLKGFTQDSRSGIFSYRAAPIQVNYLGYPGTMGADYIDYIIADKTLIPLESQSCYSEKIVYLPNSYQVNDRKRLISDRQYTKEELHLPKNGFVFCCFNNNFKILPATFDGWMRILKAVDGSVLWLLQDNTWVVDNLKKEAEKQGIASDRILFAERMSLSEHLARHRQADLFLDTAPYNAHTTTSDALWAGLPVLTFMGRSFAGRVSASLLNAIGLPELITNTQQEYEALAINLAMNPMKIKEIKLKLANNLLTTPLFNSPLFTKNIEAAYIKMHEQYHAGLEPEHIYIA